MDVEFTARGVKISKAVRAQAEEGMERIGRILGRAAHGSVTFSEQRHLHIVELTVQARTQKLAATGKGNEPEAALRQALSHAENQARKYKDRKIETKRLPKEEKIMTAPPAAQGACTPDAEASEGKPARGKARASIAVHSFPAKATVVEPHIIKNGECFALKPLTIEEAVKDAEFRDRDLLIFRDPAGETYVLHRRRDGQMELVEIP